MKKGREITVGQLRKGLLRYAEEAGVCILPMRERDCTADSKAGKEKETLSWRTGWWILTK